MVLMSTPVIDVQIGPQVALMLTPAQVAKIGHQGGTLNDDLRFAADHIYKAGGATCRPGGVEGWRHLVTMRP